MVVEGADDAELAGEEESLVVPIGFEGGGNVYPVAAEIADRFKSIIIKIAIVAEAFELDAYFFQSFYPGYFQCLAITAWAYAGTQRAAQLCIALPHIGMGIPAIGVAYKGGIGGLQLR